MGKPTYTYTSIHNESACHTQSIICKDPPPGCHGNLGAGARGARRREERGRSGKRRVKRRQRRWRRFGGNVGWKQTLLEICITTPRGGQRRWVAGGARGCRGWLSVEKAGAHTSIRGTTPRPGLLRHLSELYCHPSTTLLSLLHPLPIVVVSPSNRPLFHGQLSACLQCSPHRVFMSSLALKPPTFLKFDAPRTREMHLLPFFSAKNQANKSMIYHRDNPFIETYNMRVNKRRS